jgi:dephospho-CoA kinase
LESEPYIIIDIPLLVEKNYQKILDYIIVVDCLPEQQIERVRQRDKLNDASIQKIMQTQASREDRNKAATHILDNSSDKASLLEQIKTLHDTFLRLSKQ